MDLHTFRKRKSANSNWTWSSYGAQSSLFLSVLGGGGAPSGSGAPFSSQGRADKNKYNEKETVHVSRTIQERMIILASAGLLRFWGRAWRCRWWYTILEIEVRLGRRWRGWSWSSSSGYRVGVAMDGVDVVCDTTSTSENLGAVWIRTAEATNTNSALLSARHGGSSQRV